LADRVTAAILGVRQIVVDPSTPTTLYAVVHGSGVYTSVAGGNWVATAGQPSNLSVTALVMKDSNTLFAATDGGGVFISNDQGAHWQVCPNVNAGLTNLNLRTLMLVGGTLYAGATSGIFKSTDQCTNWTAMSTGLPQ
jgi:ligand-binding sensor domain-containing protein